VAPVGRIDKHVDGQAGRFERIFAAHTRAHAVDEMVSHLMSKKDTNGGRSVLNVGELGVPKDIFDKIDKNSDGQVGKAEINTAFHARIQAISERTNHLIARKDTNGDGMLNIEELGVSEKLFAKIDKNGDGLAGRAELSIAARTHAALNNMISEILPPEKASKLDATV
jgi:Ca2+-binding EF-hand superfamily protein